MIDTSNWKEFKVSEVFETEKHGNTCQVPTGAMMSKKDLEDGDIPRITVSNFNNGITGYYAKSENKNYRVYNNFISVSFLGTVFYQSGEASLDMKVHCLKPLGIELNEYTAGYIVSVIRRTILNFAYSDQLSSTVLSELIIKLPATPKGEPDWEYMESYMKNIVEESEESIENLRKADGRKHLIDVSGWGEFTLTDGDIFHISRGQRLKGEDRKPGNIRYFSASNENNGLTDKISNPLFIEHDAIIFSTFGDAYYVKGEFTASDEISIFKNNKMNEYSALFICGVLKALKSQFQFNEKAFYNNYKDKKIKLPVTSAGEPDWDYMEEYMKNIEKSVKNKIDTLSVS